jgi:hypothetical protein
LPTKATCAAAVYLEGFRRFLRHHTIPNQRTEQQEPAVPDTAHELPHRVIGLCYIDK